MKTKVLTALLVLSCSAAYANEECEWEGIAGSNALTLVDTGCSSEAGVNTGANNGGLGPHGGWRGYAAARGMGCGRGGYRGGHNEGTGQ